LASLSGSRWRYLALIIGVVPILFNNQAQGASTAMTFWTFVIGFSSLSSRWSRLPRSSGRPNIAAD
jgi:hypothetical protein